MNHNIVHTSAPVTLLGGGEASVDDVNAALSIAPVCIAADSGAELARLAGVAPAAVIGDFDSISPETLALTPPERRLHISEQDSTDFDKALRHIVAPVVVGVGFLGARLDHQLAALHVLAAQPHRRCVLLGPREIALLCPPWINVDTQAGDIVSLFPLSKVSATSRGLRWDIEGVGFDPMAAIGTSNEATGALSLTMTAPGMILILPRRLLADVTKALAGAPLDARWPVRAPQCKGPTES